jgi:two-component system aerobic respiration control sensor histidine kinase ArcB
MLTESQNILEFLEFISESMPGNFYWKDKEGRYLGCNTNLLKVVGFTSKSQVVGKSDTDLWPEQAPQLGEHDKKVLSLGETQYLDETITVNNEIMYFRVIKIPLKDFSGKIIGIIGTSLDVSELKRIQLKLKVQVEKAEIANQVKAEFIRNMQHDIRTPFNGLLGITRVLLDMETNAEKKELLGYINQSAEELLEYCNAILDFSKIESGVFPILEKKFEIRKFLQDIYLLEFPGAKLKNLDLTWHCAEDVPSILIGDPTRLQRILINLVSNSIKFTDVGFVSISVKTAQIVDDKNIIVYVEIADSGIGIPVDKQDVIYEKLERATPSYQGFYRGMGIGLRIVKQFIDEMNGEIELQSELAKGTKFTCTLPFKLPLIREMKELTNAESITK